MGKKPAEIEQEIRDKREAISHKIDEIVDRSSEDIDEISNRVQEFYRDSPVKSSIENHPFMTVAGALGVGVVLGMASESIGGKDGRDEESMDQRMYRERESRSQGRSAGLLGGVIASLEEMAVEEGRRMLNEWMEPTRGRENGSRDGHRRQEA